MRVSKAIKLFLVPVLMLFTLGIGANVATADDLGGFNSDSGNSSSQTYNWDNQSNDGNSGNDGSSTNNGGSSDGFQLKENDDAGISNMLRNQHPVTKDSLSRAQSGVAPLVRIISGFISIILVLLSVWLFAQSAIDLVYLCVPASRGILNPNMAAGGAAMGAMGGGMGMGAMGGGAQVSGNGGKKWISDEAEQALNEGQAGSVGAANGAMGMNMGMGMGMGMVPQQNKPKNVLGIYLKKRIGFMILFAISLVVLFCTVPLTFGTTAANTLVSWVSNLLGI